jgi:single-strand DNA-binding protein
MSNPTVTIVGRIGQDPEAVGSNGLRLRVATNDRVKNDSTGEWEDKNTSWWTVKAWKRLAEQSMDVLKKGQEVIIIGKVYEENWTDKEGTKRTSYEINAESIAVTTFSLTKKTVRDDQFPSYKTYAEVPF